MRFHPPVCRLPRALSPPSENSQLLRYRQGGKIQKDTKSRGKDHTGIERGWKRGLVREDSPLRPFASITQRSQTLVWPGVPG